VIRDCPFEGTRVMGQENCAILMPVKRSANVTNTRKLGENIDIFEERLRTVIAHSLGQAIKTEYISP
jgi:hypothetical protein